MMRSPPPPPSQQPQPSGYGNPYQPSPAQGGSGTYAPGFSGFINDPTAQMGFQVGKTAMAAGQEYMEQNVSRLTKKLLHSSSQALLQRIEFLRPEQARTRALPLATQALVSSASTSNNIVGRS
jgi:hypothetical protein